MTQDENNRQLWYVLFVLFITLHYQLNYTVFLSFLQTLQVYNDNAMGWVWNYSSPPWHMVTTPLTPSLSHHHNCDDNNKPLSLVTLFSTRELPWTPRCACFFVKITTNLYVLMLYPLDPLYCHLCSVARSRRSKWLLRRVVCLHSPILDPLLVYYSHQVCCLPLIHFIHWNYFCLSLHVNLDMGKTVYAHLIMNDIEIPTTIIQTSTLPEELGRINIFWAIRLAPLLKTVLFSLYFCVMMIYGGFLIA